MMPLLGGNKIINLLINKIKYSTGFILLNIILIVVKCLTAYFERNVKKMADSNTTTTTTTTTTATSSAISTVIQGAIASYATYYTAKQTDNTAGYVSSGARTVLISSLIAALSTYLTASTKSS